MARFLVILSLALIGFTFANRSLLFQFQLHILVRVHSTIDSARIDRAETAYNFAYPPEEASSSSSASESASETSSIPISESFQLLFFALFAMVEPEKLPEIERVPTWANVVIKIMLGDSQKIDRSAVDRASALNHVLRAGLYLLISLVILMNLLIAMLTDTYQEIEEESDKEWKFGRAKLIRNMQKTVRSRLHEYKQCTK